MEHEQLIELLEESIATVNALENKIEEQVYKNENMMKAIEKQSQLTQGDNAEQLMEVEDKIDTLSEQIGMGFKKLEIIEKAYRDLESDAIERINSLKDLEEEKNEMKEEILTSNLSTLNRDLNEIIEASIRTVLKKRIDKLDALESDERFEKIMNAEDAVKKQKNNIYKGVATIVALGVIAVFLL